jgi:hypothetical protein
MIGANICGKKIETSVWRMALATVFPLNFAISMRNEEAYLFRVDMVKRS